MEKYYYLFLNIASFAIPFLYSFERKWMHFIRFYKPYFAAIMVVGIFFLAWDVYFAYQEIWGFNEQYLTGIYWFRLPLEEWLFFLLIPYSSNFIHYSLEYFFPSLKMNKSFAFITTLILFFISLSIAILHHDKTYTVVNFGVFSLLMLLQLIFRWSYIQRFYLSFIVIYIPFFFVNSSLTGSYSENPVVHYNNAENLGIRIGTMPVEDSFYCFSMLYGNVLLFEFLRRKWKYCLSMKYEVCKNHQKN